VKGRDRIVAIAAAAILAAVAAVWFAGNGTREAPTIELLLLDGQKLQLSSLRGAPVLVTFWATTCAPCRKEVPRLASLQREFGPQGLRVLAVAMAYDPPARVLEFAREHDLPYTVAFDMDGAAARAFDDVGPIPATFVIDARGRLVFHQLGEFDEKAMRERIEGLLAEHKA